MRFYFAFGANMEVEGMARRCPGAKAVGIGSLEHHRFAIVHPGYATVIPAMGSKVYGVLWLISTRHLAVLDAYENLPLGLYGRAEKGVRYGARLMRAHTYFVLRPKPGRAQLGYLEDCVLPAARHWGLPQSHIAAIEAFRVAPGARDPWREDQPV